MKNSLIETREKFRFTNHSVVYVALVPTILFFLLFFYYPFFTNVYWMFTDYNFLNQPRFVGLDNIVKFFHDEHAWNALKNTGIITVISTVITISLSLFVAMAVFYLKIGKGLIRGAVFSTYIVSIIVAAIMFKIWFSDHLGYINGVLESLGLNSVPWLTDPFWAMVAIIVVSVWLYIGYFMVIFLAGFSNIDSQLFEAGMIDGANKWQMFISITLPQLKPVLTFSMIIAIMSYLKTYPAVVILTNGGPYNSTETILMYMFDQGFQSRNAGYASVIGMVIFLITLVVTYVQLKFTKFFSE